MAKNITVIDVSEFDELVIKTYNKFYNFQQQDGCKDRGKFYFTVPVERLEDYDNDTIPMVVNGEQMGVSFKSWLETDINTTVLHEDYMFESDTYQQLVETDEEFDRELVWDRNFYPHVSMIIDDLHKKGLLQAGDYIIDIDW